MVRITPGINCEAVPASDPAGAGMRRHVHSGNHAAESFVSFIPLFDGSITPPRHIPAPSGVDLQTLPSSCTRRRMFLDRTR